MVAKTAAEKMSQLEQQGYDFEKLKKEIESASQRHKKNNGTYSSLFLTLHSKTLVSIKCLTPWFLLGSQRTTNHAPD